MRAWLSSIQTCFNQRSRTGSDSSPETPYYVRVQTAKSANHSKYRYYITSIFCKIYELPSNTKGANLPEIPCALQVRTFQTIREELI